MKMIKRIIAIVMSLLMLICLFPMSSTASQVDDIIAAAKSLIGSQAYNGYCLAFCRVCYEKAGIYSSQGASHAMEAGNKWIVSTSSSDIPIGACVFFNETWAPKYGHVGIYIGNGKMIDAQSQYGGVQIRNFKTNGYRGWGWYGGVAPSGSSTTQSNNYASVSESNYNIINKASGKYLNAYANAGAAKSTTNICASNADNSAEQKFKIEGLGNNKYLIRSLSNSNLFCVDIKTDSSNPSSGTNVYLYSNTDFASKHWYFEDVGGGYYVIRSVLNSNLVLSAVSYEARANVCVQTYTGSDLQKWQLVNLSATPPVTSQPSTNSSTVRESNFNIISKSSGNYLNAFANPGQATASKVSSGTGSNVCVSNSDGTMEQVWKLEKYNGSNQYYIRSCSNTGYYCVNAWSPQNYVAEGADVRLYNYNTTSSKHWTFEDAGGGYYVIRNVMNANLVLTADGNENRANVCVRSYTGGDNQKWKLVDLYPVETPAPTYTTLDLNGYYNNEIIYDLGDMATADVYINGALVADDTNDFCADYPVGTNYEITDIKPSTGYAYTGVHSGSLSGTLGTSIVWVYLSIEKNKEEFVASEINSDKVYSLANKSAGTYLNCFANDSKVVAQTNVCASNPDNSNEQKFKLQSIGDGKYLIRSLSNANLYCVDVHTPANVAEDGANVWMYHNTDYASKHWYFESVGDGYYVVRNALNANLVLTAESNAHRANVIVKSYTGSDLQKWKLSDVTTSSGTGESASQSENIQKLNAVMRNWINVQVTYSQNVDTSKTEIVDFNNPPATMDCSSFTSSLYLTVFGVNIGRNTRIQQHRGAPVGVEKAKNQDYSNLMIGDLILFDWNEDGIPNHVGLYSGNGKFIHMTTGNAVVEASLKDNSRYKYILTIRRIIQQDGSLWPWTYIAQGDVANLVVGNAASAAIVNGDVSFEFDYDEQRIINIMPGTLYGDILINTEYDKLVVCNKTGGELLELTREYVTSEEYSANEISVLSGTIAKFFDKDSNLMFVGECCLYSVVDDTLYGDVNDDGIVDGLDATRLLQYLAEWDVVINFASADVNVDGVVDGLDITRLLQYLAEWDVVLG